MSDNIENIFFGIFDAIEEKLTESDAEDMITDILRIMDDNGYEVLELYGQNSVVDEALRFMYPDYFEEAENEEFNGDE